MVYMELYTVILRAATDGAAEPVTFKDIITERVSHKGTFTQDMCLCGLHWLWRNVGNEF